MIYTVTLNPSIDYVVKLEHFSAGTINRMTADEKLPGGKGINVSRILRRLDIKNQALGLLGGFTGRYVEDCLKREEVMTNFTQVAEDTRINIKLKAGEETEINGLGPVIYPEEAQAFKAVVSEIQKGDIVILSGSKAPNLAADFYNELIQIVEDKEAEFVIDTTGRELKEALVKKPLLVKPNNHELAQLYQTKFEKIEEIYPYGQRLLQDGAQNAIVSLAAKGALLFFESHIYYAPALKGQVKNSVGAGDSMIAGFVGKYAKTRNALEAFRLAVACGSATAFETDLATREAIEELLPQMEIELIK
ncbi:MAG: 1-phosphofructokinase [Enterococcaceae bacterium]|jgi:1-phosphofructokinase|nr:1-phosphofructokinase [Enterococcaceae bacterium]